MKTKSGDLVIQSIKIRNRVMDIAGRDMGIRDDIVLHIRCTVV
ncbi:hypothetical protein C2W58_00905 [Bacillus pumilus]|nr:hypothetical protein C2W58_00905 [Bacillus pumilus]